MNQRIKVLATIAMFVLITLSLLIAPLASAQTGQPTDIPAGYSLIDGDILMPTSFVNSLQAKLKTGLAPEATYQTNLWPNGIIPFEFDANVTVANQTNMLSAMTVLQNVANVSFQQCASNNCSGNYVHIQNSTGNNSQIGVVGGQQFINIFNWNVQFIMVHELMHCLGFFHEHSRPDRDSYVQINTINISTTACSGGSCLSQFTIASPASTYGSYDFDSVMQYGQCSFTTGANCPTDGTQTITVKAPYAAQWQNAIGQRDHISALDQATVSFLYPFGNWRFLDCNYDGHNGTSNGTFSRPYTTLVTALDNTTTGGTLWILNNCHFSAVGTYSKPVTIRVAPGSVATLGN